MYFVITDPSGGASMDADYCRTVRDNFGLSMPVLLDASRTLPAHIGENSVNDWHVVLDASGSIVHKAKYASGASGAASAINTLLAQ